jgi:hypothetical protein
LTTGITEGSINGITSVTGATTTEDSVAGATSITSITSGALTEDTLNGLTTGITEGSINGITSVTGATTGSTLTGVTTGTTGGSNPGVIGWFFQFIGNLFRDFIAFVIHVINTAVHTIFGTGNSGTGPGWWVP